MMIKRPTLLINSKICKENIHRMAEKAKISGSEFRPHFKTHQSKEVGRWFRAFGVNKITVSSVEMTQYFANDGWNDISIAFPVNVLEIDEINELASKITLNLLIESKKSLRFLIDNLRYKCGVFIKIDCGYHRTGILAEDILGIAAMLDLFKESDKLNFKGFLTHSGHTYKAKNADEIKQIHFSAFEKMNKLRKEFKSQFPKLIISMGDTPSMSVIDDFRGVDEVRPGNFVYYDLMQVQLGSCKTNELAVVVACPVVAKHNDRKQIVIYGGGVHLSKESIVVDGQLVFGQLALLDEEYHWTFPSKNYYLSSISQEHGVLQVDEDLFGQIKIGELIGVIPVHSCLSVNLLKNELSVIL